MSRFLSLHLKSLAKSYSQHAILQNLSYVFEVGCYGLLGRNGVGKSTLLSILAGVVKPDMGSIALYDNKLILHNTIGYKSQLAYIPPKATFFPHATGVDFINFINAAKSSENPSRNKQIDLIQQFKLCDHLSKKISSMSLGLQKKLFLSSIFSGENKIILLDEPTNGLDELSVNVLTDVLTNIALHTIVVVATHDIVFLKGLNAHLINLQGPPISNLIIKGQ